MAGIVPDVGETRILSRALGLVNPTSLDLTLKLFVNDYTPVTTTLLADLTEMSTQGYVAKTLAAVTWGVAQNGSNEAEGVYPEQTFTFDGTGGATTIYGYWIEDENNLVLFVERFAVSFVATNNGDLLKITPTVALYNEIP